MNKPKTEDELSSLLIAQIKAGMDSTSRLPDEEVLGLKGIRAMQKYHDYRESIQKYQVENQISAIQWQSLKLGDRFITFPKINDQLNCLDSDLEAIRIYKKGVVEAWAEYTQNRDLMFWYDDSYQDRGSFYLDVTRDDILRVANSCEWAMIYDWDRDWHEEIVIEMGWGNPLEAGYYCHPDSGSFHFHSALRDSHMEAIKEANSDDWKYEYCWASPVRSLTIQRQLLEVKH
jgi:hypothetical protein